MDKIGLVKVNSLLNDYKNGNFVFENDNAKLRFDEAYVDFFSMTVVLHSKHHGFLRTPMIREVYLEKDDVHNTVIMHCKSLIEDGFTISCNSMST